MISIDLNADLGEGMGDDTAMLALVSSASIACGGHAGDETTMRRTVRAARAAGVRVGAHPGFADPAHFGRRRLDLPLEEIAGQVREQVAALRAIAAEEGAEVAYVKLHGGLANMAAEDEGLARTAFAAVKAVDPGLAILAIDNSAQVRAAEALGLVVIREAYGDRAYTPEGLLVPRSAPGAVITDPDAVAERCLRLARAGQIVAIDGTVIESRARSICLHGDTPGALAIARMVREALAQAGVAIAA